MLDARRECPGRRNKTRSDSRDIGGKIDEGAVPVAVPVINADVVLTGVVLLLVIKQSSDWYSAVDGS